MAHIRSRKHSIAVQPRLKPSLLALAALAVPLASHAQQTGASEQTLPEVKVRSTVEVPYKAETSANPKLTQPLVDTPQTISVIKKEIIQQQGAADIMEALRNTPGITMQLGENGNTSAGDTFQMRGVAAQSSIFVDGVRDLGAVTRDTFNLEQLEVVKGPAGADTGRGASAGYINLISKLPTADNAGNASFSINSAINKRATVDLNRKIGENAAIRLNAMAQNGGVIGRNYVEKNGFGIAPSVAFGLGTPTRVYFYTQHLRHNNVPDGGIPSIGVPGFFNATAATLTAPRVNPKNYYGSFADYEKIDADMATAKVEHNFGNGMVLTNITRYGKSKIDRILTGINALTAAGAQSTWTVARTRQALLQENEIFANQTNVTAEFTTGAIQHSFSGGVEFMSEKQSAPGFTAPVAATITAANLYNPNPNVLLAMPTRNGSNTDGSTKTAALYASDTLKIGDRWQFNGGLRFEHYTTATDIISTTLVPSSLGKSDNLLSWKLGALYKPAHNGSVYLAYANSKTPPGSTNFSLSAAAGASNPAVEPQEAVNIELGTKWDVLDKKLSLTAALYRTDIKNELPQLVDPVNNIYSQFGKRRVEGIELGAVGQLTPKWDVSAALATMKTKVIEGTTGNNLAGAATRWSPELTATLWSAYKLTENWTVGGGMRYVSEQKRTVDPTQALATQNVPNIPDYWVADAMLSYKATKNLSLQLNLYNLFDKFYISTLNNSGARLVVGAPRSGVLTASLQF